MPGSLFDALSGRRAHGTRRSCLLAIPFIVTGIVGGLLATNIGQVLGGLHRALESPAALPPGIFEAFGKLVPTTMVVDDLEAGGVLETPTSPWAVLPLLQKPR